MPHFTLPIDAKGPLLNVSLSVSDARQKVLTASGVAIPDAVSARGLVDTGASCTAIDPTVIQDLQISPTGKVTLITPSTGKGEAIADQYDVSLAIYAGTQEVPCRIPNLAVIKSELFVKQGFHALIGRDVLSRCLLTYNGSTNLYTLAF